MNTSIQRRKLALVSAATALLVGLPLTLTVAAEGDPSSSTEVGKVQLLRVHAPTRADRNELVDLGLDVTANKGPGFLDVVVHSAKDRALLRDAGFTWKVLVDDVVAADRARARADKAYAAARPGGSTLPSGRTSFRTLADYDAEMTALAAAHPSRARIITLNHASLEGRTIRGLEVSNNVAASDGKPTFLMMGVHHAREWPSSEVTIEFAHDLLQNSENTRIANILDNVRVLLVPVVNPDGFQVSRSKDYLLKRKNCRIHDLQLPAPGECALRENRDWGVDPNRNYGAKWGGPGASGLQSSEIYRGAGPFSEPETQNIQELVSSRQVVMSISNHTYGGLVLRPPGYALDGLAPDEELMRAIGDQMAAEVGYDSIYGWQLYDTTGTTDDWVYSAAGGLAFTFEHATNGFQGQYARVVELYTGGTRKVPGGGLHEAFLVAAESSLNEARHSVIEGTAPAGVTLRLRKVFLTSTWDGSMFLDTLTSTMVVPASGFYSWHVNPSTRPGAATEAWTFTCENPAGTLAQTLQVTVDRGETEIQNLTC